MTSTEIILEKCKMPPAPVIAVKILRLANNPMATVDDLKNVIIEDQVITSHLLKIANASFYRRQGTVGTVTDAIFVVGFNAAKMLTIALSTRELYNRWGLLEQKLWEHSMGVSIAAGLIAYEKRHLKIEEALVAGLLHDIGKIIMYTNKSEDFTNLMAYVLRNNVPFSHIERNFFDFGHAEIGALLAKKWNFPDVLSNAIGCHHSSPENIIETYPDEFILYASVALADLICLGLGVGYKSALIDLDTDLSMKRWVDTLNISPERLQELTEIFKETHLKKECEYRV